MENEEANMVKGRKTPGRRISGGERSVLNNNELQVGRAVNYQPRQEDVLSSNISLAPILLLDRRI